MENFHKIYNFQKLDFRKQNIQTFPQCNTHGIILFLAMKAFKNSTPVQSKYSNSKNHIDIVVYKSHNIIILYAQC